MKLSLSTSKNLLSADGCEVAHVPGGGAIKRLREEALFVIIKRYLTGRVALFARQAG